MQHSKGKDKHESGTKPKQTKNLQPNHQKANESSIQNSVTETELKPNEDQNKLELGTKPKKKRNRPSQRERAKKAANEKRAARKEELANNCVESYFEFH